MNSFSVASAFCVSAAISATATSAIAQNTDYYAGRAAGGQPVVVELDSIYSAGQYNANFTYRLGNERIPSQASCAGGGSWTTLDDGAVYRPQSRATRNMVNTVCRYLARINDSAATTGGTALVYDPPSNIRSSPNGDVLCSIDTPSYINIYRRSGSWYATDACGQRGVIHESQIRR